MILLLDFTKPFNRSNMGGIKYFEVSHISLNAQNNVLLNVFHASQISKIDLERF